VHKRIFWLHRILGLTLGLYAAVLGITGGILAFHDELLGWEHPALFTRGTPEPPVTTPDQAVALVRERYPGWRILSLTFPNPDSIHWHAYLLRGPAAKQVFVSTRTQVIRGERDPKSGFVGFLEQVHFNLLGGRTGRLLNGIGACGLLLLSASGLWIWRRAAGLRDLHSLAGAASFLFLVLLAITGAYFTWSQLYTRAITALLPREARQDLQPVAPQGAPLPLAELARRAAAALPGPPVYRIPVVDAPRQPIRVTLREGEPGEFHRVSSVLLNPYTRAVLQVSRLDQRPAGDALQGWLSAFHFGVFGGWPVKALWALGGFALAFLAVSGFLLWWPRIIRRSH
jgi:uncharacterized iron-regulated membrane protein